MRAFLGIGLPDGLRRAAAEVARSFAPTETDWRALRENGLHITIRFLGECDAKRQSEYDAAWLAAASGVGPLTLRLRGAAAFPSRKRPRVIGLGVDDLGGAGALAELATRVEQAARRLGFPPEPRPFSPHVTLARARSDRPLVPSLSQVGVVGDFVASRLVLFRSELGPGGARYFEESSFALHAGAVR